MPLSEHSGRLITTGYPDVKELQASAADLVRARTRFLDAIRRSAEPPDDRVEMAGAEMLRQATSLSHKLRRGLSALMVAYATLWADAHDVYDDFDETSDFDDFDETSDFDDTDVRIWSLDRLTDKLGQLIAGAGKISEGLSHDGRVRAAIDDRVRRVELDFDPRLLDDSAYRASIVEAVNAGIAPVVRRRHGVSDAMLPAPEPPDDALEVVLGDRSNDGAMGVFGGLCGVDEIQQRLASLLPQISRREDPQRMAREVDMIEDICLDFEEMLRDHLPSLDRYRTLLPEKARLPEIAADDLAELENLAELFLEMDLDEQFELDTFPGADVGRELRAMVATVADELQRQDAERRDRLSWQLVARRLRTQVAEVEHQTFEGRSRNGVAVARARGSIQLIDLDIDSDHRAEPAVIEDAIIDAVNAAFKKAEHRRTMAMMLEP